MEGSGHGNSYGGRYAGGDFDLVEFIKRPQTICRFLCILFAIIVFGCISAACHYGPSNVCIFNSNQDACQYGTAIGVLAFLECLLFLVIDAQFDHISSAEWRRYIVVFEVIFSGAWTFLWFVGFCFLTDEWRKSSIFPANESNHARAVITFSFFSIFTWIPLTYFAYQRYKQGSGFTSSQYDDYNTGAPYRSSENEYKQYASFPLPADAEATPYQQPTASYHQPPPPFGAPPPQQNVPYNASPVKTDYEVPNY